MASILDLLINEVSNLLGITPDEVKAKFTEEQLQELLDNSLCTPISDIGIPIQTLDGLPCDDLAIPDLLPDLELDLTIDVDPIGPSKCVENVKEINEIIKKQTAEYIRYSTLYDKLVEYSDNYSVIEYYYEERTKEAARLFGIFEPLVEIINTAEERISELKDEKVLVDGALASAVLSVNVPLIQVLSIKLGDINAKINDYEEKYADAFGLLEEAKSNISIFSNLEFSEDFPESSTFSAITFNSLLTRNINGLTIASLNNDLSDYSRGIRVNASTGFSSASDLTKNSIIRFNFRFSQLYSLTLEHENINQENGERYIVSEPFPIKTNQLLEKTSFLNGEEFVNISEFSQYSNITGKLYTDYYNLLSDPINNFFTLNERGLSSNADQVDPKLKDSDHQTKKEGESEYYIADLDKMQTFYQTFDEAFTNKKNAKRKQVLDSTLPEIKQAMRRIAKLEVETVLALNRIDQYTRSDSSDLSKVSNYFTETNTKFNKKVGDLSSEISRVKAKAEALKPTPEKVKALLKRESPECFDRIDEESNPCDSVISKLGSDPMFTETLGGADPSLPNQNQMCYWLQFSLVVNMLGLLPMPNLPDVTALRYWPVGLTIPSPGGLIKIPLPIIWIPLISIPSPMGTMVIFLTINGLFISPIVFFVSSTGEKQHIITAKGSSDSFGYTSDDENIKPGITVPIAVLAAKGKAERLAKTAQLGANDHLSSAQKLDLDRSNQVFDEVEKSATASGNTNRLMKLKRERTNLNKATENKSPYEKMANILDKGDSPADLIDQVRHAIFNQFDKLGKPVLNKSNKIKDKINKRDNRKFKQKQKALNNGDYAEANKVRGEMKTDGIAMPEKINAITSDMFGYFDRLQFPKVTIPKDATKIDPKQNAIFEFMSTISDFASTFKTQFQSAEDGQLNNILSKQLAKSKAKISNKISESAPADGKFDLNKDIDKIKKVMSDITSTIVDDATGQNIGTTYSAQKQKVEETENKEKSETDPAKKLARKRKTDKAKARLSEVYELEQNSEAMKLTAGAMAALSGLKVDYNPFSSCCAKDSFTIPDFGSPAMLAFGAVKGIMNLAINNMSFGDMKSLFGGQVKISINDISTGYLGMINQNVPKDMTIPLPNLNLVTFMGAFSGLFISLFEVKAPILAAQPALPTSITIDLNILKAPLRALLETYLTNSLPSKDSTDTTPATPNNTSSGSSRQSDAILDNNIRIFNFCDPDPEDSILSGSNKKIADDSLSKTSKVVVTSSRDVLPSFQTLDTDFLSVNPGDLLAILKNFIDMGLGMVEDLITPFYSILDIVKSPKNTNLNAIQFAQQKIPPPGPGNEAMFTAITQLKKIVPKSSTMSIVDLSILETSIAAIKPALTPIINSPLPALMAVGAGAIDSVLPPIKTPSIDSSGSIKTQDLKVASYALRQLNPVITQDDIPPWERLSPKNILFLVFLDKFISSAADKVGLFRNYL